MNLAELAQKLYFDAKKRTPFTVSPETFRSLAEHSFYTEMIVNCNFHIWSRRTTRFLARASEYGIYFSCRNKTTISELKSAMEQTSSLLKSEISISAHLSTMDIHHQVDIELDNIARIYIYHQNRIIYSNKHFFNKHGKTIFEKEIALRKELETEETQRIAAEGGTTIPVTPKVDENTLVQLYKKASKEKK